MYFYPRWPRALLSFLENLSVQHVCWAGGQAYHFACQGKTDTILCFHFIGVFHFIGLFHGRSRWGGRSPPLGPWKIKFQGKWTVFSGQKRTLWIAKNPSRKSKRCQVYGPEESSWRALLALQLHFQGKFWLAPLSRPCPVCLCFILFIWHSYNIHSPLVSLGNLI